MNVTSLHKVDQGLAQAHFDDVHVGGHEEHNPADTATLIYEKPNGESVRKNVMRTTTLIGSHASCNMQLLSTQVSELHCLLTLDARGFRVWDLRSQTGTFVNGQRVRSCRLKHGDDLKVGSFHFRFETTVEDQARQGFFIDEYRVLGILGTGGMGWLYVVDDPRTLQKYALKVLMRRADQPGVDQEELRTRFLLEGKAGKRLQHPHIVDIYDYQLRPDLEYMLLELFESINLQELVQRDGSLSPGLVCEIARQSALALQHIHEVGSVHRDVKPSNILVGREGLVKVCDFGLVYLGDEPVEEQLAEQMGNDCLGTADYISPEQSCNSYRVDGRSDVYSLGCTMYLALTGRLPFPKDRGKDKIMAHRHEQAVSIRHHNPQVPDGVIEIVERCMRKNPDERYASAQELAEALAAYAQAEPVSFNFGKLLAQRTQQASFRLADPKKKHYLQRVPANVASSLQAMGSNDHLEQDQMVLTAPLRSEIPTQLPGDTSAATQPR